MTSSRVRRDVGRRFCLVTTAHVCNNPRVVKEADALHAAGCAVRVVSLRTDPRASCRDATVMAERPWRLDVVDAARDTAPARWFGWGTGQRAARAAFALGARHGVARDLALSRYALPLAAAAMRERADVYVAHNLQALPAAAWAAHRAGAKLGFDIEDLHTGELPDTPEHAAERGRRWSVEKHYLPRCEYLTAASPGIADAIVELYGVRRPIVILNTFPPEPLPAAARPRDRLSAEPSLYWFSQVAGPDRGIEDALEAVGRMRARAHLNLRGAASDAYRGRVLRRAGELGCADRVHFLDIVPPAELIARSAEHDVGLALEQPYTRNRDVCVTNKLFTYMLAGLAVAATDTAGQRSVLAGRDVGAFLYPPGDAASLARRLDELLANPERLAAAKRRARAAAEREFSWEADAARLVSYLTSEPKPHAREAPPRLPEGVTA